MQLSHVVYSSREGVLEMRCKGRMRVGKERHFVRACRMRGSGEAEGVKGVMGVCAGSTFEQCRGSRVFFSAQ